jgi:hypothetical protein
MDERLSCWDDVLGTMPEATLAVRRAAFRRLLSGTAPAIEEVAAEAGLAYERLARRSTSWPRWV